MITARVIAETTVHNEPREIGDIVEVCENTFRNLSAKGRLEAVSDEEQGGEQPSKPKGKGKGKGKTDEQPVE